MVSPSKRSRIKISVEAADPSSDPVVVSFSGGVPVEADGVDVPDFVQRRFRDGAKSGRKLIGRDATCLYKAENPGRGSDGRRTKLCIGILNRKTGILHVTLAAEKGTVFALQQSIPKYAPASSTSSSSTELTTAAQRRKALFQDFGSTKKQRTLKSQEANRVTADSVVGAGSLMAGAFRSQSKMSESNRKALDDSELGQKHDAIELAYAEARLRLLPTFDNDAKDPYLVYNARDISGEDVWDRITRLADVIAQTNPFPSNATMHWHPCVLQILQSMPRDSPQAKSQIKTAILLNYMISFHLQPYLRGDVQTIARTCKISVEVCQRFLSLFATPVMAMMSMGGGGGNSSARYATSKPAKDKCRVYMLILYVMTQGGKSMKVANFKPIVDNLKMDMAEASNLLREAGFSVAGTSAALTVPLTFPPPKRGGKAK